jgi:hypothetical protein
MALKYSKICQNNNHPNALKNIPKLSIPRTSKISQHYPLKGAPKIFPNRDFFRVIR